ncbi:glycosyltransferase [Bacillus thuringiensis]|uniref:glycosyltransferase n=1 Tax=Bacillus thuringiensis TaxID=1428 RepID=UPI0001A1FB23|nr:glycosyltransferase [Bacillus thuringiensis]EEM80210.1 Glycosyl transferase, family 2 [Bacillus thuringiensis serovar huazhongensis BGSC 4BD1]
MGHPLISIVIPVRNESHRLIGTIKSILDSRSTDCELEIVIVDDASDDGSIINLPTLANKAIIRVFRLDKRVGVPSARNYGTSLAHGDIIFMTDSHVRFSQGWDRYVLNNIADNRIIAATICDTASDFKGYGCRLVVPYMGTWWNTAPPGENPPFVQIASCAGTVLTKTLFDRIGGYDPGMILYGGAEPEFSLRAWLSGAEIVSVPSLEVFHRFKTQPEVDFFLKGLRPKMIHNNLRFGFLYLSELASLQMIRHFAMSYPDQIQEGIKLFEGSDVWKRKAFLKKSLRYDFEWFVLQFHLKNQIDQKILL